MEKESIENQYKDWKAPKTENKETGQSSREYNVSPVIKNEIVIDKIIFHNKNEIEQKYISPDSKVCLIGDGQGADTLQVKKMGVKPKNIVSVNYERSEVIDANNGLLKDTGIKMKQGDATNLQDLIDAGAIKESQDYVVAMHVLEVPGIKGEVEKRFVQNLYQILKPDGELLVSQYKRKLTSEEAEKIGVQKNEEGIYFSELSNIRSRDELINLFQKYFEIEFEENNSEYILRMKKK